MKCTCKTKYKCNMQFSTVSAQYLLHIKRVYISHFFTYIKFPDSRDSYKKFSQDCGLYITSQQKRLLRIYLHKIFPEFPYIESLQMDDIFFLFQNSYLTKLRLCTANLTCLTHIYTYTYVWIYICVYIHIHYIDIHIDMYINMYIDMCIEIHIYTCKSMLFAAHLACVAYVYIYVDVCMYIYMYTCICIRVYMYVHT